MAENEETRQFSNHEYIEFERQTFQDNIILCDAKCGILLGFGAVLLLWCLDALLTSDGNGVRMPLLFRAAETAFYAGATLGLLVTIGLTWSVIRPRISQADDYIYWGSAVFRQSEPDFIKTIHDADGGILARDMLRQLHVLAGICRRKFDNFRHAVFAAECSAVLLFLALFMRIVAKLLQAV